MSEQGTVRQALHELLMAYVRGADRGDPTIMKSAFHADGRMETGLADPAIERYAAEMVERTRSAYRTMYHSISNESYEIFGDRARGECYVTAFAVTAGQDSQEITAGGRYLDQFERREGIWKIRHRRYIQDWRTSRPAQQDATTHGPTVRGAFYPDDPAHDFWARPLAALDG